MTSSKGRALSDSAGEKKVDPATPCNPKTQIKVIRNISSNAKK
jgi:hypothetical protein